MRNEDAVQRVTWERNTLQTVKIRKGNWIGYILLKNCLLSHVIEGKMERRIEVMGRRGRPNELLDVLKEERGYWQLTGGNTRSCSEENWLCKRLCTTVDQMAAGIGRKSCFHC